MNGIIFDIKEFAIYDGPGLRQTVFFKGCPLRCSWCHNPEGLSKEPEEIVNYNMCTNCGKCKQGLKCPNGLRRISGNVIDSKELVEIIHKNAEYYSTYGGGVTFSGGEPLLQAEFLSEVLDGLAKIENDTKIHTAIETSGYAEKDIFQHIINKIDYVLMDIKLMDNELHMKYTSVYNMRILDNVRFLCSGKKPFVIRIPLIPGVTDTEENLNETAKFIKGAGAEYLEKIELLPYHKSAGAKYKMTGKEYKPDFDSDRELKSMNFYKQIFHNYGMEVSIL